MAAIGLEKALLEKKLLRLERRFFLLERFVEMRFCESFRDFSDRNSSEFESRRETEGKVGKSAKRVVTIRLRSNDDCEPDDETSGRHLEDGFSFPNESEEKEDDEEEKDKPFVSYRTRSGRAVKRLTAAAMGATRSGGGNCSAGKSKSEESSTKKASRVKEEIPISKKVLRVSLPRLSVIPLSAEKYEETLENDIESDSNMLEGMYDDDIGNGRSGADEDEGDNDYFTFPTEELDDAEDEVITGDCNERKVGEVNEEGSHVSASNIDGDPDYRDSYEPANEEVDNDDDYSSDSQETSNKKMKSVPNSSKAKKRKRRKSYHVPSRIGLLPEGVQLQILKSSQTQLKECPICHQHRKPESFESHVQSHVKERNLKCSICDKGFFKRSALVQHQRLHQPDKYAQKCRLCSKVFINSIKVLYHERICIRKHLEDEKPVNSEIIDDVRQRSKNVDLNWPNPNKRISPGKKKCVHCKKLIKSEAYMAHIKEAHSTWKCTICERTYIHKSGLVRHLCRAHGKNSITCDLCKKTFESKEAIRSHNAKCREDNKKKQISGMKLEESDDEEEEEETCHGQEEVEEETCQGQEELEEETCQGQEELEEETCQGQEEVEEETCQGQEEEQQETLMDTVTVQTFEIEIQQENL